MIWVFTDNSLPKCGVPQVSPNDRLPGMRGKDGKGEREIETETGRYTERDKMTDTQREENRANSNTSYRQVPTCK